VLASVPVNTESKPTKLAAWLDRTGMSHRAFAKKAGIPKLHPMVGLWAKGRHLPGLVTAFAIERGTEGAIPVSYWLRLRKQVKRAAALASLDKQHSE
jgi:hypothetical protein